MQEQTQRGASLAHLLSAQCQISRIVFENQEADLGKSTANPNPLRTLAQKPGGGYLNRESYGAAEGVTGAGRLSAAVG